MLLCCWSAAASTDDATLLPSGQAVAGAMLPTTLPLMLSALKASVSVQKTACNRSYDAHSTYLLSIIQATFGT